MQVYNGRIFNAFLELKHLGFQVKKLNDGKYKVWHVAKDWIDEREFIFETLDELQAFVEGLGLGITIEFETEWKMKKDKIFKEVKKLLKIMNETI